MIALGIKFFLAHILGDFVFQPDSWVKDKVEHKQKSAYLYLHTLVHLACLLVFLAFDSRYWLGIVIIVLSHYVVDLSKLHAQEKFKAGILFILDQVAHIAIILWVISIYQPYKISLQFLYSTPVLLFILSVFFVTFVTAIIIKNVLGNWRFIEQDRKSIFRFSDLSRAKDRKLTEYILVGTLLSIIMAILTAFAYQYAQQWIQK